VDRRLGKNRYIGVEISNPMRQAAIKRFSGLPKNIFIDIVGTDLREDFPEAKTSVVLSVLTLQFIPIEYRQEILKKCFQSLNQNGVIILVEKVLGNDAFLNNLFVKLYYELKGNNGYTEEQINTKRKALEGVLVPVTSSWNQDLLKSAGFSHIEVFWRNLNFAGWIGIKN
jgi:tRNA (cmo5U34)-methyltransferase